MSNSAPLTSDVRLRSLRSFLKRLLLHPATHIVTGIGILLLDLFTGPFLSFPILFVIPVVFSAWFCSARLAYALSVLLPLGRFLIAVFRDTSDIITASIINALIRVAVLSLLAFLVARTARQSRELKVLRGLVSICMFCKRIRNESGDWERLEIYIANHSEVDFSHGLCPECAQEQARARVARSL